MSRHNSCVIYARVSTDEQSTEMQLTECRRLAEFRGWGVSLEYVDNGHSGTKATRPALERLMRDVRCGKVGRVLVWKLDRFGRSASHLVQAIEEFNRLGVEFVSMTENLETSTPMGRAVLTILAAVAQLERDNIAERTKAALAHAKRRGVKVGRPRACSPGEVRRLVEDEGLNPREASKRLGVGISSVKRRLAEARQLAGPKPSP